jgi:hypothetical protein
MSRLYLCVKTTLTSLKTEKSKRLWQDSHRPKQKLNMLQEITGQ